VQELGEELGLALSKERVRQAETDARIRENISDVLHVLKPCRSEQQRVEYHIILAAVLPHRDLIVEAKKAARELHQNATPGMLLNDSDWAENGKLEQLREFQSEYWSNRVRARCVGY